MLKPEKSSLPIRLYNRGFKFFGISQKLEFERLIKKARDNTGLNDLGKDFNDEALKNLIKSINEEAKLHPFGRLMIKEKLTGQLESRLWAEHWFSKHPEILEQEVLPVLMITGLQRTGTTKMQRMLSMQQGARALMSWEALYPAPIGNVKESSKRLKRTRRNEMVVKYISPTFHAIHPIYANQPEEDVLLLDIHFMSSSSEAIMHVPGYASWLEKQDHMQAYEYEKKLLKLLQWQRNGKFWVLKSPHHLQYLHQFSNVLPNSRILWMHRDIRDCIPSYLSMLYYSRNMFVSDVDKDVLKSHWLKKLSLMLQGGITYRNSNPERIVDVQYDKFMLREDLMIAEILGDFLGDKLHAFEVTEGNNNHSSNHQYRLKDWDLETELLHSMYSDYVQLLKSINYKRSEHEEAR